MTKDLISIVDHDESIRRTTTLQMQGMNGLQFRNHLAGRCGIPGIFITAYEKQDSRQRAMQAGADAFLGQPSSEEQLLQTSRSASRQEVGVTKNLIAVVDDDECVRRTTSLLIESFGFQAAVFESAESFLNSGQLQDASCLIVDVQMPGMNGLQLQNHLAAAGSGIPIIFITAYDDKKSRERALQAGAVAFLGKPFSDEHLLQTIRSALRQDKGGTKTT